MFLRKFKQRGFQMLDAFFAWYNGLTDGLLGSLLLFAVGVILLIKGGD